MEAGRDECRADLHQMPDRTRQGDDTTEGRTDNTNDGGTSVELDSRAADGCGHELSGVEHGADAEVEADADDGAVGDPYVNVMTKGAKRCLMRNQHDAKARATTGE